MGHEDEPPPQAAEERKASPGVDSDLPVGNCGGDHFTAAELTFAALLAPVMRVAPEEGYGAALPRIDALDDEAKAMVGPMARLLRVPRSGEGQTRTRSSSSKSSARSDETEPNQTQNARMSDSAGSLGRSQGNRSPSEAEEQSPVRRPGFRVAVTPSTRSWNSVVVFLRDWTALCRVRESRHDSILSVRRPERSHAHLRSFDP